MRKRILLTAIAAIMGTAVAMAQQIAVVSESGSTDVYQTLTEAIEGASDGSVIYLPGGGFQIDDSVKITKRLSIIGIGHKAKTENVDGNTTIAGNLFFNEGASGSSVMGCYISGNVNVGEGDASVNNVTIKYCNLNSVQVSNSNCSGTIINQNYLRNASSFNGAGADITNNIMTTLQGLNGGKLLNNIVTGNYYLHVIAVNNSSICNNIFFRNIGGATNNGFCNGGGNNGYGNMYQNSNSNYSFGDDKIILEEGVSWNDVFVNNSGVSPASDFHFTAEYQQYSDCGIYGGTGFSDGALPPVPFIVAKSIPEQTDAAGNLNIKIRVKAGE